MRLWITRDYLSLGWRIQGYHYRHVKAFSLHIGRIWFYLTY